MLRPLSRDSLTKQATETLRRFILTEGLEAGASFPTERELSESLAVSRNIVREALSVLVAEGLINKQPGRGIFINEFDRASLTAQVAASQETNDYSRAAVSEARCAIELGAIRLIAARITDEQIQHLQAINQAFAENIRNRRTTIKHDIDFHTVLLQASHNPVIIDMIPLLVEHFRLEISQRSRNIFHNPAVIAAEHQRVVDALRAHDEEAAYQALLYHFEHREQSL